MGPRSDNRGYVATTAIIPAADLASMGPRSDNRGYALDERTELVVNLTLQWVHGRITVVMKDHHHNAGLHDALQWVHGRITVVMQ